ncbi:hypothetical protein HOD38_01705 [archaeon]|jgi:hypothetical protein|nr:hypothetical protein [archaeon]MBT4396960.1 hypothetical protein [archaeon]MBT4440951.1 hypothetical protein [archaeon]
MKKKGDSLEIFTEHLFKDLGKKRVRRNKTYKRGSYRAQIDLVYGLIRPSFVECKNYSSLVSYADFMKFVGVCETFNPSERVMVTTSDFEGRCYHDAHKYGVKLINGPKLKQLYRKSRFLLPKNHKKASLSKIVRDRSKQQYKPSVKRRAVNYSKYGLLFAAGVFAYEHQEKWLPLIQDIF